MLPVTVALNDCVAPVVRLTGDGVICTLTGTTGAVTVIVTSDDAVLSATAIACTWKLPATAGAVYTPALVTEPPPVSTTLQVTD
ncbi:MAG TPA: hypothetical protein VFJ90_00180 [Candidatus Didemnitutus sp.]|nr:hypothetical protein [Candidatus Didemnitutus sp.]